MNLGYALRQLRKQKGLTLAELADRVDSHVGNLSRIERGLSRPSLDLLYKIAEALDYSLCEIFSTSEMDRQQGDTQQTALNAVFISLLANDRSLLVDFARLLQSRAEISHNDEEKVTGDLPRNNAEPDGSATGNPPFNSDEPRA